MAPVPSEFSTNDQLKLIHHCINGDVDEVRSSLSSGRAYPHYHHPYNGWTALHYAAACGEEGIVRALLEAGYEREAEGHCGEVPYDVASSEIREDLHRLLGLLHFDSNLDYRRTMPGEAADTAPSSHSSSRRGSMSSGGYTPPFTSRPPGFFTTTTTTTKGEEKEQKGAKERKPLPLSASRSTSFDFTSGPGSPGHSPSSPSYSYGRRDSLYRTRFLLVRTSSGGGKEAYTRVTLPGGSGVEQLKRTIEKAIKLGRVDAVFTLPEGKIIQFDDQICAFANHQKIDVLYSECESTPEPVGDAVPSSAVAATRKPVCPPSTSYSTHPSLSREQVSMDVPTTIREGEQTAAAAAAPVKNGGSGDFLKSVLDDSIKDASLVEIPSEAKELEYSIVEKEEEEKKEPKEEIKEEKEEEKEEEKREEIVVEKEQEEEKEEEEVPKEPTPTPVTPASPTVLTIPVQKSEEKEEEEEEEEEEEVVEKTRPFVIRQTTLEEKREPEPEEEQPKKVESVRSDSNGGFEEVSREDVVDATREEAEEVREEKEEREEPTSTTTEHAETPAVNGEKATVPPPLPKVVLTKADSSSSPFVDFINEHPELVRKLVVVGVVGAACGVAYMVMRKHR